MEPALRALANACVAPAEGLPLEVACIPGLVPLLRRIVEKAWREASDQGSATIPRLLATSLGCLVNLTSICRNLPNAPDNITDLAPPLIELLGSE